MNQNKKIGIADITRALFKGMLKKRSEEQIVNWPQYGEEMNTGYKPFLERLNDRLNDTYNLTKDTLYIAWHDPRLKYAFGLDAGGYLSYLGMFGGLLGFAGAETVDTGYAVLQTAAIRELYGRDMDGAQKTITYVLSFLEEAGPGAFDWFPTALVTHLAVSYNIAQEKRENAMAIQYKK